MIEKQLIIEELLESALESNKHCLYMDVRDKCTEIKKLTDMR